MNGFAARRSLVGALASVFLLALPASAAPLLTVSSTSIALTPGQTVITFGVDPNGELLSGVQLNFSALASGLVITAIQSLDGETIASDPMLSGGDYLAGFIGGFLIDRDTQFTVGTLTLEGLTPGTPLVVSGSFAGPAPGFIETPFGPMNVATVVPEPGTGAMLLLGMLALGIGRRASR